MGRLSERGAKHLQNTSYNQKIDQEDGTSKYDVNSRRTGLSRLKKGGGSGRGARGVVYNFEKRQQALYI